MSQIEYRSPVRYPAGWARTPLPQRSLDNSFGRSLSLDEAMSFVEQEVQASGVSVAVVYTAYDQIRQPKIRRLIGSDTAASLLLKHDRSEMLLACDKWQLAEHNLYALHLALRAMRQMEQWGVLPLQRLFGLLSERGDMPQANGRDGADHALPHWMETLGLGPTAEFEDANAVYRRRVKLAGSDETAMLALNQAIEQARDALRD